MNFMGNNSGTCGCKCPTVPPTYQQCYQVVQTCNVEEVPHMINYHTHMVNNCIKKHVNIPTYTVSEESVLFNEYPQAQMPIPYMQYQQPGSCGQTMNPYMQYQQPMYAGQMAQYQGNVGTEPFQQQMPMQYGMPQYPGMNMPFNY